jgi:hypothetical protein
VEPLRLFHPTSIIQGEAALAAELLERPDQPTDQLVASLDRVRGPIVQRSSTSINLRTPASSFGLAQKKPRNQGALPPDPRKG